MQDKRLVIWTVSIFCPSKMPSQPTATETRLNNGITCLTGVVETLEILADSFKTPFLEPISNTARSLLTIVQVNSTQYISLYATHSLTDSQKKQE
jgi:hypothetical protein